MPHLLPLAATALPATGVTAGTTAAASASLSATLVSVASQAAVSMAINAAMSALSPKVGSAGRPVDWTLDPDGPIPFAFGRVGVAGAVVHKRTFGPDKMYYGFVSCLSGAGPIDGFEAFTADDFSVSFNGAGMAATSEWRNEMWRATRLGHQPDTWLPTPTGLKNNATMPNWGSGHRASGKALSMLVMGENSKRTAYPNGEVKPLEVIRGLRCWDPRLDDTYSGGSGPQRLDNPATWVFSQNPIIHALKWCLGLWEDAVGKGAPQVGQQVGGIGSKLAGIDVPAFVAAANVCDANGWTCAAYPNTDDDKHQVLVSFLQAGGAIYSQRAGKISLIQRAAPRASVVTITADDVVGAIEVDTAASRIDRINTIQPSYWSPQHRWQVTALPEVTAQAYRDQDGGKRSRGITYPYVTNANQASQLTALDIAHARESMAGQVALKPHLQRIQPGDTFTISEPGFLLDGVKVMCLNTEYDPAEAVVRVTFVSETDAKYPFALGQSTVVPTPPTLTAFEPVSPPMIDDWVVVVRPVVPGQPHVPGFDLTGVVSNATAHRVVVEYALTAEGPWTQAYSGPPTTDRVEINVQPNTEYWIAVSYYNAAGIASQRTVYGPFLSDNLIAGDTTHVGGRTVAELLEDIEAGGGAAVEEAEARLNDLIAAAEARAADALLAAEERLDDADAALTTAISDLGLDDLEGFAAFETRITTDIDGRATNAVVAALQTQSDDLLSRIVEIDETLTDLPNGYVSTSSFDLLQSEVGGLSGRLTTAETTLADLPNEIASSSVVQELKAELEGARDGAVDLSARLLSDRDAVVDGLAGKASSSDLTALSATVSGQGTTLSAHNTRLNDVEADVDGLSSATDAVTLQVDQARGTQTLSGRLNSINQARIDADGVIVQSVTSLSGEVETERDRITAANDRMDDIQIDVDGRATSTQFTSLSSEVIAARADRPSLRALVDDLYHTTVDGDSAQATRSSNIEARLTGTGDVSARITESRQVAVSAQGTANAVSGLTSNVNGVITGYASVNDGATTDFAIQADRFRVVPSTAGARTEFSNGAWRIYDAAGRKRVHLGLI